MSTKMAIIGGSRFVGLEGLAATHTTMVKTPYGEPSSALCYGILNKQEVVFLSRRGEQSVIPPHKINYRANIWALRDAGVKSIIATAAVAGISELYTPGCLIIPDQLIDYTSGRENTFFGDEESISHVIFGEPYSAHLRQNIIDTAKKLNLNLPIIEKGTYGVTQGPRFETQAEVACLAKDGCDFVGMTGMPEAALARELGLEYACIALVVRRAGSASSDSTRNDNTNAAESALGELLQAIIA